MTITINFLDRLIIEVFSVSIYGFCIFNISILSEDGNCNNRALFSFFWSKYYRSIEIFFLIVFLKMNHES